MAYSLSSKELVVQVETEHRELSCPSSAIVSGDGTGSDFDYFGVEWGDILDVSSVLIV